MKKIFAVLGLGLLVAFLMVPQPATAQTAVDLELALLVDVSGSIDNSEFLLQKTGYVNAFNNINVWNTISQGALGKIAATMVFWSGDTQQSQVVGWALIDSYAAAQAFATSINTKTQLYNGSTAVQSALNYGGGLFANNGFDGTRQVIDISGDGADNNSRNSLMTTVGRQNALNAGVDTINGLVILGENGLQTYYQNNVIGGTNPLLFVATGFDTFATAIEDKIITEIHGSVPEPGTLLLLGCALAGLYGIRRKVS